MWWLAPRQRPQAPVVVQDCFAPPGSPYHSGSLGAPPNPPSSGTSGWLIAGLAAATIVAGTAVWYFAVRKPGWYVSLFNYPVGDPDRRLKSWMGPYATRDEAVAHARTQVGIWYPKVEHLDVSPRDYYP